MLALHASVLLQWQHEQPIHWLTFATDYLATVCFICALQLKYSCQHPRVRLKHVVSGNTRPVHRDTGCALGHGLCQKHMRSVAFPFVCLMRVAF